MSIEKSSINYQDGPHHEGPQNNTPSKGQSKSDNNQQPMSNMLQDSEEQLAGRKKNQDQNGEGQDKS